MRTVIVCGLAGITRLPRRRKRRMKRVAYHALALEAARIRTPFALRLARRVRLHMQYVPACDGGCAPRVCHCETR